MGIAKTYVPFIDSGLTFPDEDLDYFIDQGREEFIAHRVETLVARWKLMNVYITGGMPREATAKLARQVARNTCSWLMRVNEIPAYDWSYTSALMPDKSSEEYRALAHRAASLDINHWLHEWREEVLSRMTWFCTISAECLDRKVVQRKRFVKMLNKTANAVQKEMDGCVQALSIDEATPSASNRRASSTSEEG